MIVGKTILVAAMVSAVWAVLAINAFLLGMHIAEQGCPDRSDAEQHVAGGG